MQIKKMKNKPSTTSEQAYLLSISNLMQKSLTNDIINITTGEISLFEKLTFD